MIEPFIIIVLAIFVVFVLEKRKNIKSTVIKVCCGVAGTFLPFFIAFTEYRKVTAGFSISFSDVDVINLLYPLGWILYGLFFLVFCFTFLLH